MQTKIGLEMVTETYSLSLNYRAHILEIIEALNLSIGESSDGRWP